MDLFIVISDFLQLTLYNPNIKINIGDTMGTSVVVKTQIKEIAKTMNISNDFQDELEKIVTDMIKKAMWRAQQNKRTTVMARDL